MNLTLLTASICALCVVYALSIWIPFHISSIALRKALKNVQGIDQNSMQGRLWEVVQLYCKTFKGGNSYTTEYSGDYITVEALAAKYNINLRVVNSSPNILTSIGILGTFIGLTLALFHFDSGSTESIRESINSLLSGMSTAFLTSVFGMLTSSIFLFCERRLLNKIGNAVSAYTSELDATYHATNDQVLVDALSFVDVNGAIHTPGSVMSAISNNMAAVQNEIQNLGNNIAASITDALDKEFDNKLVPIIEGLAHAKLDLALFARFVSSQGKIEQTMAQKGLQWKILGTIQTAAYIGPGHKLFHKPDLSLQDFENDYFLKFFLSYFI